MGTRPPHLKAATSDGTPARPPNHLSRAYRGVHRRRRNRRDSWTRHHGDLPALPLVRSGPSSRRPAAVWTLAFPLPKEQTPHRNLPLARRLPSTLVRPFRGGQTRAPLHLRRQISGDFHACANFDDYRFIPAHELNSLSFSPRGPVRIPRRGNLAPFALRVICFACLVEAQPPVGRFARWLALAAPLTPATFWQTEPPDLEGRERRLSAYPGPAATNGLLRCQRID
jgi:hypothetical protein